MFLDFGLISVLLVCGHLLRAHISVLHQYYVPTPIIAGGLGLLFGPQGFNWLPFSSNAEGHVALQDYPNYLVAMLFATLFMGARQTRPMVQSVGRRATDTFCYSMATQLGQYGLALLIGELVLVHLFPTLHSSFALMLPGGFAGGHGTATAISTTLEANGWKEAKSVGFTFATIGLLSAVIGGMILINIAVRRGWTRLVKSVDHDAQEQNASAFVREGDRPAMGQETVNPIALDPLAWHIALVLVAFSLAVLVQWCFKQWISSEFGLPLFALAVLTGMALQRALNTVGVGQYVDRRTIGRIGSTTSDYLIAVGITSIKLEIVSAYAMPLILMSIFGVAYSIAMLWWIGRRIYHNFWFERSIFTYGWNTGVVASGITLLRVVDPRLRTKTLEDYGVAYMLIAPLDIILLVVLPPLIAHQVIIAPALILVGLCIGFIVLSRHLVGWFLQSTGGIRPCEQEVIEEK